MTFKQVIDVAIGKRTRWRIDGTRGFTVSTAFMGSGAGVVTLQWANEPKKYEYVYGSSGPSIGVAPLGVSWSPEWAKSVGPTMYQMPGTVWDLVSTDIPGPFVSVTLSAGKVVVGGYVTILFLGTTNKITAVTLTALLSNPASFPTGLAAFKAVALVAGWQFQSPGASGDIQVGMMYPTMVSAIDVKAAVDAAIKKAVP